MKCKNCGKEFTADTWHRIYCCRECNEEYNRKRAKVRYHALAELDAGREVDSDDLPDNVAICLECGKMFVARQSAQVFCNRVCYEEHRRRNGVKPAPKPKGKSLSDWEREAKECNLDYGTYRGLIEQGKTFEELKAQAPNYGQRVHNHTPRRKKLAD